MKNFKKFQKIPKISKRNCHSHKGDFGRVCILAGSLGMSGAAVLAATAALRAGAGLVTAAVPKGILPIVASMNPCYMTTPLAEDNKGIISKKAISQILQLSASNDVMAAGPGIAQSSQLRFIIETLIKQQNLKLILDADGLNNLAKIKNWNLINKSSLVLTPHPGEMKRLWQSISRDPLPTNRDEQAAILAQKTKTVVVLKGAETVVADSKRVYVNETGNPGMATGGSGDVLTGILAALIGQKFELFDAAVLAVYVHGLAADIAAKKTGQISLVPTDIIEYLSDAFINIDKNEMD
ncbi:MAG: NAD(P)H-hydrate dehydratase [Phycisphaerae bacterium]|nr:NAD(P)H-hydrate dehydratase [Phycisphaerae bacterium]